MAGLTAPLPFVNGRGAVAALTVARRQLNGLAAAGVAPMGRSTAATIEDRTWVGGRPIRT